KADDGAPLLVVVEVKPGYDMHTVDQICREIVDAANTTGLKRVACVMVGADLGRPASTDGWELQALELAAGLLSDAIEVEVHYSSFAALGQIATRCGLESPEWLSYAQDVNAQLARKGLLGYEGAPMFDDLDGLTVSNAVELFNRAVLATS